VPPVEQSGVDADGPQTENTTVPWTVPLVPVRVAVSVTESPIVMWPLDPVLVPLCLTWVEISGAEQNENVPPAKSDRVASRACDERVSAMKLVKQPVSRPSFVRSIPPSKNSAGRKLVPPDLFSNGHGAVSVELLVAAHATSVWPAFVHGTPVATTLRL